MFEAYRRAIPEQLPASILTTSVFGDRFHADFASSLEWQIWLFGTHEKELGDFLNAELRGGDTCIDVGANIGVHTVRMARVTGTSGRVIAIEADVKLADRLAANVELNGLKNVDIVRAAASDVSGRRLELFTPAPGDPNKARASLLHHQYLTGPSSAVQTVTVDELAAKAHVALIKVDVEGVEIDVLRGARATLERDFPVLVFEYNRDLVKDDISPLDYCRSLGYQLIEMRVVRNRVTGRASTVLTDVTDPVLGNVNIVGRHPSHPIRR
jgi:FkbM family methyltransferase